MTEVTERGLNNLLLGLGAQLEAAERRAEDEAADDLALSLAQDATMADSLTRGGAIVVMVRGGGRLAVSAVGADFLWIDEPGYQLIPIHRAVVRLEERGSPPARWERSLVQACRVLVRAGAIVEVTCTFGSPAGKLELAGRDFLAVATDHGRTVVPYKAIQSVRVIRGGLAGVP